MASTPDLARNGTHGTMRYSESIDTLNRLLSILYRSLPMYLASSAAPWSHPGNEKALAELEHIVTDQKDMVRRIGAFILDRGGTIELGEYPMDFTDTHFLSIDFLVQRLVEQQIKDIADIEECVALLANDREARDLAEEALGMEKAHLESLEELARTATSA